jgi:hypothetical protein
VPAGARLARLSLTPRALCTPHSHDGAAVYTASRSLQCRRWEIGGAAPACTRTWKAHPLPVNDIAVDASGALLVRAAARRDAHARSRCAACALAVAASGSRVCERRRRR